MQLGLLRRGEARGADYHRLVPCSAQAGICHSRVRHRKVHEHIEVINNRGEVVAHGDAISSDARQFADIGAYEAAAAALQRGAEDKIGPGEINGLHQGASHAPGGAGDRDAHVSYRQKTP